MLARSVAKTAGMPGLNIIEIPHPLGGLPEKIVQERAKSIIDGIISGLTRPEEKMTENKVITIKQEPETIKVSGGSNTKAIREVNRLFYERYWSDGFPIIPPTQEAVDSMLAVTGFEPDELIGLVPPRLGKATVKNIAINSVMAGAEPEYMPVIIAAVKAVTDKEFASGSELWGLAGMQSTTGPVTPLLIINGPIAYDLHIESGIDCFGRGHRANATIGRALRLVLINAGGAYPGTTDMKCQGSAQEFTFCVAEREKHPVYHRAQNRWEALHIEKGYSSGTSTVTAAAAFPPINVKDSKHCGPEILNAIVDTMTALGQEPLAMDWQYVLVLSSTHAQCLADAGMSKKDIREFLYANGVMPWGKYKQQYAGAGTVPGWITRTVSDTTSIHLFDSPDNIIVIVAGGEGPSSQIIRCSFRAVTKEIRR